MKNVLLLSVADDKNNICVSQYKEAAACCLTSFLREQGYEVKLIDGDIKDLKYSDLEEFKPDVIGIHDYYENLVNNFLVKLKTNNPDIKVCLGLGIPSPCFEQVLKCQSIIDYAIYGEEPTWLDLLNCLEESKSVENVKGLIYRKNDEIIINEPEELIDLNTLPYIAIDSSEESKAMYIQSSRGCTNHCSFCYLRSQQRMYRMKDVKRVVDEMEYFAKEHNKEIFIFSDYSFEDPNKKRLKNLLEEIINRDLNIVFHANFRPSFIKNLDLELIELLRKAGLTTAFIGIESGNDEDLKLYKKGSTVDDGHRIINMFSSSGINTNIGFINFNPYSTLEKLRKNIDFLDWHGFATFENVKSLLSIEEGTQIYETINKEGLLTNNLGQKSFEFKDARVYKVYKFVVDYISYLEVDGVLKAYEKECSHLDSFYNSYYRYKRMYEQDFGPCSLDCTLDYYYRIKHMPDAMSHYIANWFKKLLDLAEKGFDEKEAQLISVEILSPEFVKETTEIMKAKREQYDSIPIYLDEQGRI